MSLLLFVMCNEDHNRDELSSVQALAQRVQPADRLV
jgi:hypothetical protein